VKAYRLFNAQWILALLTLVRPITPPDSPQNQFGLEIMSLVEHFSDSLGAHLEQNVSLDGFSDKLRRILPGAGLATHVRG
jgi:hypothetical protein